MAKQSSKAETRETTMSTATNDDFATIQDGYESVCRQVAAAPPDAKNLAEARRALDLITARGGARYLERIGRVSTKQVMVDMIQGRCPECGSDEGIDCTCYVVERCSS